MTVREIDKKIIEKTVDSLLNAGACLSVRDNLDLGCFLRGSVDRDAIVSAIMDTDESILQSSGCVRGLVFFVLGNDGFDVINDYSCNLEDVLGPVFAYCDELEEALRGLDPLVPTNVEPVCPDCGAVGFHDCEPWL